MSEKFPIVPRPKLALWCWLRGLGRNQAAELIGCNPERAWRLQLPFGHVLRARPSDEELAAIVAFTGGEVTAGDFFPPHLNGDAGPAAALNVEPSPHFDTRVREVTEQLRSNPHPEPQP